MTREELIEEIEEALKPIRGGPLTPETFTVARDTMQALLQKGFEAGLCSDGVYAIWHYRMFASDIKITFRRDVPPRDVAQIRETFYVGWSQ